jgi:hypothetical protein
VLVFFLFVHSFLSVWLLTKFLGIQSILSLKHPVPVTVLNDFKLCPRSRDCEAIINTSL